MPDSSQRRAIRAVAQRQKLQRTDLRFRPASAAKRFPFGRDPNQTYTLGCPAPVTRGVSRSSRTLGAGCGGRR
jgi:hypothetical protein